MSSLKSTKNLLKLYLLLIPSIVTFLFGWFLMGSVDALYVTVWQASLMLFTIVGLPLCFWFFRDFSNGGYSLSKSIGLLSTSILIWTLTYLKIYLFSRLLIIVAMLIILVVSLVYKPIRNNLIGKLGQEGLIEKMVFEELIFSILLVTLCYFKGMYPDINGQEKFMDYGFIMSMLKSDTLPAKDMWLSGKSINYYYYGQYVYAMITKLLSINPGYAYTISLCTSIAIPFMSAYSIGFELTSLARKHGAKIPQISSSFCGILTGLTTMILGNSHSFFYDENSIGNKFLDFFSSMGFKVGKTTGFFYPDSTRFIGHNPDSYIFDEVTGEVLSKGDYTIHEFPFYSYLVGDLHAHVISMMVVTLIAALAIAAVYKVSLPTEYEKSLKAFDLLFTNSEINEIEDSNEYIRKRIAYEGKNSITPEVIAIAILLGIAQMTNYWDFLIYFIFCAMALLVINTVRSKNFSTVFSAIFFVSILGSILAAYILLSENVILHVLIQLVIFIFSFIFCTMAPSALTRTSFSMSFLFVTSTLIAMPFNMNFEMISNKLAKVQNNTSIYQFLILWGTHLIIIVGFIIYVIFSKNYVAIKDGKKKTYVIPEPADGFTNPIAKFVGQRNLADVLACGIAITGLLMLAAPEIIYVRDIYTSGYLRANTMFKFTFAGFILLSIVVAYAVIRLFWFTNKNGNFSGKAFTMSIIFALLLFIPGHYTIRSLEQRCGTFDHHNYKTLDGTAYISTYESPSLSGGNLTDYMNCINWFNENVDGSHNIVEAYGNSYTDYNIVSAYTGNPTIIGWQTHEWLWRFHGIVDKESNLLISDPNNDVFDNYIDPRHADINTIYSSKDPNVVKSLLTKYDVEYIISGPLEFALTASINNDTFDLIGDVVYESNYVRVYKVN